MIKIILTVGAMFALASCNSSQPKIVSELLFEKPFEEMPKKFGAFEKDDRAVCTTPPNCDFYYGQQKMENGCLWRGMNAMANHKSGKIEWAYLAFGGKCNGIEDQPKVSEYFSKDDPKPSFLNFDESFGNNGALGRNNAWGIWESGDVYVLASADCYDPSKEAYSTNFMDCRLMSVSIKNKDTVKPEFKKNNFKFHL